MMQPVRIGGYDVIEMSGAGGMAEVYRAYDRSVDRFVAIKMLHIEFSQDPAFRMRFEREAKAIALLEHAHILPLYAYGEQDGVLYLVMRYMPGGSLDSRIAQHGPLPLADAAHLLRQMASALDYAHENAILHRDFKTDNVLLDANGDAFIADFGLAKLLTSSPNITGRLMLGTPAFMSPEQAVGKGELTGAADQYALGVVLYHMVTGQYPFNAQESREVLYLHLYENPPSPRQRRPDLPILAEEAMLRALAKHPEDRFLTCTALAEEFYQAIHRHTLPERIRGPLGDRIDSALSKVQQRRKRPHRD